LKALDDFYNIHTYASFGRKEPKVPNKKFKLVDFGPE